MNRPLLHHGQVSVCVDKYCCCWMDSLCPKLKPLKLMVVSPGTFRFIRIQSLRVWLYSHKTQFVMVFCSAFHSFFSYWIEQMSSKPLEQLYMMHNSILCSAAEHKIIHISTSFALLSWYVFCWSQTPVVSPALPLLLRAALCWCRGKDCSSQRSL